MKSVYRRFFVALSFAPLAYLGLIVLLAMPWMQHQLVFLNYINVPRGNLSTPEDFGYEAGQVNAFHLPITSKVDNETLSLGVWHIMPKMYYKKYSTQEAIWADASVRNETYSQSLKFHPTVIYFHGNAANRAAKHRKETYAAITDHLGANLITFDYRGFGDSTGWPTEQGIGEDAEAVWKWLLSNGVNHKQIILVGHSLGTAVATQLAARLSKSETSPRALILKGGFNAIPDVIFDFSLFGLVNLLYPFRHSLTLRSFFFY